MIHSKPLSFFALFLLFFSLRLSAQYYDSGTDPASIHWSKIETNHFKIVFASAYEKKAQEVAKILEELYDYGGNTLKHSPGKIKVLIHSETAYSNGYVTWAPKRVELYAAPSQDMHSQDWLQQLVTHEFRHVVQIDKIDNGFTKILSYIFGEQAVGAVLGLYVPLWFLEGDAVTTETALSHSGRGRLPWFEMGMRALVMEKGRYPYEKAYFGSYKDYVPDYYEMGYQLVAGARAKYGPDIWERALYNTGRNPFLIPFNQGQKKVSKINKVQLYKEIYDDLKQQWIRQDSLTEKVNYQPITPIDKRFVNFKYPQVDADGDIIAELNGPGEVKRFVKVDSLGNYTTIYMPGSRKTEPFSVSGNTLFWAELIPDMRWEQRYFSDIKLYNMDTRKVTRVTHKQNYSAPVVDSHQNIIACVKATVDNQYALAILDIHTGNEINTFTHGHNDYIFTPSWNEDDTKLVCIVLTKQGKQLVELDLTNGEWNELMPPTYVEIALPYYYGDEVIFTGSFSGTEEQYVCTTDGEVKQLTQSKYGTNASFVDNHNLIYSNYTADGYQLVSLPMDKTLNKVLRNNWINGRNSISANGNDIIENLTYLDSIKYDNFYAESPLRVIKKDSLQQDTIRYVQDYSMHLADTIAAQEPGMPNFEEALTKEEDYEVKPYSKWNLFNVHSWAPVNINIDDENVTQGVSAMSQNLLGSAITTVGYNADPQSSSERYYFNFTYQGWYPVITFNVKYGDEKIKYDGQSLYTNDADVFTLEANTKQYFTNVDAGIYVPFNLTSGKYSNFLQPSVDYSFIHQSSYQMQKNTYESMGGNYWQKIGEETIYNDEINYNSFEYGLYFHHLLRRSNRDIATRWGQLIELKYAHTPLGNYNAGAIAGVRTKLYFPGVLKHHAITVSNNYQYKFKGDAYGSNDSYIQYYRYGNLYDFPRGYTTYANDRLYSFKGDYIFPLWNPDFVVPGFIYMKRIVTNLFCDYSWAELDYTAVADNSKFTYSDNFLSAGFELRSEIHFFRFLYPLTIGYRYSHLIYNNQNSHSLLLGLSFSGFAVGKRD